MSELNFSQNSVGFNELYSGSTTSQTSNALSQPLQTQNSDATDPRLQCLDDGGSEEEDQSFIDSDTGQSSNSINDLLGSIRKADIGESASSPPARVVESTQSFEDSSPAGLKIKVKLPKENDSNVNTGIEFADTNGTLVTDENEVECGDESDTISVDETKGSSKRNRLKKTYPEMIIHVLLNDKLHKGLALQTMKRDMKEVFDVESPRFAHHLNIALKKMIASNQVVRQGSKYKLQKNFASRLKAADKRKSAMKAKADFQRRLKKGKVTLEEIQEHKRMEELEKEKKARKRQAEQDRLAKQREEEDDIVEKPMETKSTESKTALTTPKPVRRGPLPSRPKNDLEFRAVASGFLSIMEFCCQFSDVLKLYRFTCSMFYKALSCDKVTTLLREIHLVLLALCLEPEMQQDSQVSRWDWFKILNSLTWPEIMRRYLIRNVSLSGSDSISQDIISQAISHLHSKSYVTLPIEAKVAILHVLVDDVSTHPEIVEAIDGKVSEREELHRRRWNEEWKYRKSFKRLQLEQRYLARKEAPPEDDESEDDADDQTNPSSKQIDESGKPNGSGVNQSNGGPADEKETGKKKARNTVANLPPGRKLEPAEVEKRKVELERNVEAIKKQKDEREDAYLLSIWQKRLRSEPWGYDSKGNSFWFFECDRSRVYIYGKGLRGEPGLESKLWRYYDSVEQLDLLLKSCKSDSKRERQLKRNFGLYRDIIVKNLKTPEPKQKPESAKKGKGDTSATIQASGCEDNQTSARVSGGEIPLFERIRPRRNAAKAAEDLIRDHAKPGLTDKSSKTISSEANDERPKEKQTRTKTWSDDDPEAFLKWQNLLNHQQGLELSLDAPTKEELNASLDDPDVKLFQDAERLDVAVRVLTKDLLELVEFLDEFEGLGNEFNSSELCESIEKAFGFSLEQHSSDGNASMTVNCTAQGPDCSLQGISRNEKISDAAAINCSTNKGELIFRQDLVLSKPGKAEETVDESVLLPIKCCSELKRVCLILEGAAAQAVVLTQQGQAREEALRGHKERLAAERASKRKAARFKRKSDRRSKVSKKRKSGTIKSKRRNPRPRRSCVRASQVRKKQKSDDPGPTTLSGRTKRLNYAENGAKLTESSTIDWSSSETETDEEVMLESDVEEVEDSQSSVDDAEAEEVEENIDVDVTKNEEREVDVPPEEKERVQLLRKYENMFPVGTKVLCDVQVSDAIALKESRFDPVVGAPNTMIKEEIGQGGKFLPCVGPISDSIKTMSGKIVGFNAASYLSMKSAQDCWTVQLDDGSKLRLEEKDIRVAIKRQWRVDADNKAQRASKDDGEVMSTAPEENTSQINMQEEEDMFVEDEKKSEEKATPENNISTSADPVKVLWGTKTERDVWIEALDDSKTCSAWASAIYLLYNLIHINNAFAE